jgi:hypothetical protein
VSSPSSSSSAPKSSREGMELSIGSKRVGIDPLEGEETGEDAVVKDNKRQRDVARQLLSYW